MGDWLLKKSTGHTIRHFTLTDTCRDIVYLTLWVWRDILVNALANNDVTDLNVLPILKNFDVVNTSNLDSV